MVGMMFREIKILDTYLTKKVGLMGWNDIFILCFYRFMLYDITNYIEFLIM